MSTINNIKKEDLEEIIDTLEHLDSLKDNENFSTISFGFENFSVTISKKNEHANIWDISFHQTDVRSSYPFPYGK